MLHEIFEASFDEDGVFFFHGRFSGRRADFPPLVLPALSFAAPAERLDGPDGRFQFFLDLGLAPAERRGEIVFGEARAPLTGRLSASAPAGVADRTVTADPDVVAALAQRERPVGLIVTTRLPGDPAAVFAPVADAAAALRRAGRLVAVLHFGARAAFDADVAALLGFADVAHHVALAPSPAPDTVWDAPPAARAMREALVQVLEAERPAALVFTEPAHLGLAAKLPYRPTALLDRAAIAAPSTLAAPIARGKLVARIGELLAEAAVLAPSADLAAALAEIVPDVEVALLPPFGFAEGLAAKASAGERRERLVCVGEAGLAVARSATTLGPRDLAFAPDAPFKALLAGLREARAVAAFSDAGPAGLLALHVADRIGAPVVTDLRRGGASLPAAALPFEGAPVATSGAAAATAEADPFAAAPGPQGRESALAALLLEAALWRRRQAPDARLGLLIDADPALRALLFEAARRAGLAPLVEAAPTPQERAGGARRLWEAGRLGVETVLVGALDPARALPAMARVAACGARALPLAPGQIPADAQGLAALAGARRDATAYVGNAPPASGPDLVLLTGAADLPADALELGHAADARRGRLVTLFRAASFAFLTRPAPPALGYEAGRGPFAALAPGADAQEVMIALALHLGCAAVMLEESGRERPGFLERAQALGLTEDRILWKPRARSARRA